MKSVFLRAEEVSEICCGLERFVNSAHAPRQFLSEGVKFKKYPWDFKVFEIPRREGATFSGEWIHFTLWKKDLTTRDALAEISRKTGISMKEWCVAGWKDRKAITTQRVSIRAELENKLKSYENGNSIRLSDLSVGEQLKAGHHDGNRFQITLRDFPFTLSSPDFDAVEALLDSIKNNGVFNYAGLQRFGAFGQAFRIGRHLIAERADLAVGALLDPAMTPLSSPSRCVLEEWHRTRDAKSAISLSSGRVRELEYALLKRLAGDCRNDLNRALRTTIPKEHRRFYMHAYGCYLWNRMVSQCGTEVGDKLPILGAGIEPAFFDSQGGRILQALLVEDGLLTASQDLKGFCEDLGPRLMLMAKMRPVLITPEDFTWRWVTHQPRDNRDLWQTVEEGDGLSLLLEFVLPADSFATSVVREITGGLDASSVPKSVHELDVCVRGT
ncbi:tRNA pseudouridine synthase D, putative [Perkinsus marinus ATCC 50983]|uniref:tRNA pseudouridine synthase D, putative n=1 Tax=Perkinsus marinus (strain ATCC 50983 / TXsc) TaxID=423536 RepID=C5LA03_PERM5|nr:tRNA pseudouridine synthase D, putative [Perkinsus marinus ATCC 50983]EER06259.1 tRNA pseudouridine synthase D, putative [Perkinsus marinus ATCC 50983]|eukprot:XP_002774443.1 tRNA pseudouridine synthase D, putative [Perkinsus marinus ATCC 50983]